ncbi:MAG: DUF1963 domain-containing protein [Proteobacteria bacterium]|nr:DUF1963 domain-containing protein [Pseudomonadota bacterium]
MKVRRFEHGGTKFWSIQILGAETIVTFGKFGTNGQTQIKSFPSASAAARAGEKLVAQKLKNGYVEGSGSSAKGAKATKPKPRTAAQELAALDPALRASLKPYVRIVEKKRKTPMPLWASKACDGRPYLPLKTPWPKARGRVLLPVMQIDLSEVPALPGFPRKGLLSLFWSEDFQDRKLFYFPTITRDASKLWSDFSLIEGATLYPFEEPVSLTFEKREGCVSWGDYRFDELVGGAKVVDALWKSRHQSKIWDHVWKWSGGADTRLGGYANPEQGDPRSKRGKARGYETQLLQIQNDNYTHNVFIKPADLKRADFSDLLFYEACD